MKHLIKFLSIFLTITIIVVSPAFMVSASTFNLGFKLTDDIKVSDITFDIQRNVSDVTYIDINDISYSNNFDFGNPDGKIKGFMLYLNVSPNTNTSNQFVFNMNFDFINGAPSSAISNMLSFDVYIMKPPSDLMWCTVYRNNEDNTSLTDIKTIYNEDVGAWGSYNSLPSDKGKGLNVDYSSLVQSYDGISNWTGYHIDYGFSNYKSYGSYGFTIGLDCLRSTSNVRIFFTNIKYSYGTAADYAAQKIIDNQNENTDKILNAGGNVKQPDFDSTNANINNTLSDMTEIEKQFVIDHNTTNENIGYGLTFMQGHDMQNASIQVKNWIEKFFSDNSVMSGFYISCMVLGVCFWVIGRKSW